MRPFPSFTIISFLLHLLDPFFAPPFLHLLLPSTYNFYLYSYGWKPKSEMDIFGLRSNSSTTFELVYAETVIFMVKTHRDNLV